MSAASGLRLAAIYADLDHFKSINDKYGHASGDKVLCECARRLRAALRPDDLLVRHGGEEFVAILQVNDNEELKRIAERIREQVGSSPMQLPSTQLKVSVSIGCTLFAPGEKIDDALERADKGLYAAKQNGRDQVVYVRPPV